MRITVDWSTKMSLHHLILPQSLPRSLIPLRLHGNPRPKSNSILPLRCSAVDPSGESNATALRTCKTCKTQFDPSQNHPRACRFHTAHFGGETMRKFESVYSGGTMDTPDGGRVLQYWHCCGSEDPFHSGCTASPHSSYDD